MTALSLTVTPDFTTDQLHCVAHTLLTGDGPLYSRPDDGGVSPAPLALQTGYYAIRVDADNFKLASSSANALANVPINLADNGSGTQFIEGGIPYVQATTYVPRAVSVPGSTLKSDDLNDMQKAFSALHAMLTGQTQSIWTMLGFSVPVEIPLGFESAFDDLASCTLITHARNTTVAPARQIIFANLATPVYVPIRDVVVGDEITNVACELLKNTDNTNTVALDIVKINSAGETASGAGYNTNANSPGVIAFGGGFSIVVQTGYRYYVKVTPGGGVAPAADRLNNLAIKRKKHAA